MKVLVLGLMVLVMACGPSSHWTATYTVQGQDYPASGDGATCPQTADITVGRTSGGLDSGGHYVYSQGIYMKGNLKDGSCRVVAPK